jgi:hypothetical protein
VTDVLAPPFAAAEAPPARAFKVPLIDDMLALDAFRLAATMTLVLLFFWVDDFWYLKIPVVIIAAAGVLYPPLIERVNFWFAIAAFMAASAYQNWYTIDNHKYLMLYWCIALSACCATKQRREALRSNARWLIGLAFGFATLWKFLSKDFTDASFFYHTALTEPRFETLARWVGGVPQSVFGATYDAVRALRHADQPPYAINVYDSARLLFFARFMTWWTIVVEGTIAIAFLAPSRWITAKLRNPSLLLFLLSTYTAATVVGFGWVLAIMGYAQARDDARWAKAAYLVAFALIFAYMGPWSDFFAGVVSNVAGK